ncbi:MAG: DNA polymerase I, partial [Lachnospiraceae bacterium]|nr:DNA polymerase I [Lachnospiraceae bacterium]
MSEKIMLIDGNSIINRAYFGMPDLRDASGRHTGAVYGFLSIMFRFLDEEDPGYLAVAFDVHEPTFRHKIYPEYKAGRRPMPEELKSQVPLMKEVLDAMGICRIEKGGLEADDILGTIARASENKGMEAVIVSGDRDLLQTATEKTMVRIPKTRAGKTEIFSYHASDVKEEYGVSGAFFIDLKGLMGDTSDNIPGVPRVGEKTAEELMRKFGSLDAIYADPESIEKKSVREAVINNKELAYLSRKLAEIDCEADIDFDYGEMKLGNIYTPSALKLFRELSFKNFLDRFDRTEELEDLAVDIPKSRIISDRSGAEEVFSAFEKACSENGLPGLFIEGNGREISSVHISVRGNEDFALCSIPASEEISPEYLRDRLSGIFSGPGVRAAVYDIKEQYRYMDDGVCPEDFVDIMIAAYLIDPLRNSYDRAYLAQAYMGSLAEDPDTAFVCSGAAPGLIRRLEEDGEDKLFFDIEMPLTRGLYNMVGYGIRVPPMALTAYKTRVRGISLSKNSVSSP